MSETESDQGQARQDRIRALQEMLRKTRKNIPEERLRAEKERLRKMQEGMSKGIREAIAKGAIYPTMPEVTRKWAEWHRECEYAIDALRSSYPYLPEKEIKDYFEKSLQITGLSPSELIHEDYVYKDLQKMQRFYQKELDQHTEHEDVIDAEFELLGEGLDGEDD